jgi:hypothetical protein
VHQPLHVSFADDRGGNLIEVENSCTGGAHPNLHAAWDSCLLERLLGRDISAIATRLLAGISPEEKEAWIASGPVAWANESFRIVTAPPVRYCVREGGGCLYEAGNATYGEGEEPKVIAIDTGYIDANRLVIQERLAQAGIRLAHLLDEALAP